MKKKKKPKSLLSKYRSALKSIRALKKNPETNMNYLHPGEILTLYKDKDYLDDSLMFYLSLKNVDKLKLLPMEDAVSFKNNGSNVIYFRTK